jgi:exodeoxyribonuclease V alpha subunit
MMETIHGSVERITYYNPENGYSVVRIRPERDISSGLNRDGLLTAVGNLPELSPGEHVRLRGHWANHPRHGVQLQVEYCEQTMPATEAGVRRYLGSGLIKGIGPRLAERIVDYFGGETLTVIDHHPNRLLEVPDIGPKRAGQITRAWDEQRQVKEIMLFLHGHRVSTNLAIKIFKQYGDQALEVVQTDPYQLARDIYGVGFKTADGIAQNLGLPPGHPSRIEAGALYVINQKIDDGHVYVPRETLIEDSAALLEVPQDQIPSALDRLLRDDRVRLETLPTTGLSRDEPGVDPSPGSSLRPLGEAKAVYLTPFYHSETGLASRLKILARTLPSRLSDLPPAFVSLMPDLSQEQILAIRTALTHPVSVLTGGPGTGKTTAIRALIGALEETGKRHALCAPTGRAAKRLSESTGHPASTIHRLLGFSPAEGFKHHLQNPLPIDLLVVDEASMLDLLLAHHLFKALEPGTHVLLVGDADQLPSVGAGDVLRDLIASDLAPVTRLNVIFRQASGSWIITNAHRINRGQLPQFPQRREPENAIPRGDFFLFPAETAEEAGDWVENLVCERIPATFGIKPAEIQTLSPLYRGPAGVTALNARLQNTLNPGGPLRPERALFGQIFRLGDRVMQTQNDYDKDVYNGDIGAVSGLDPIEHTLQVAFDDRQVTYDWVEADQLTLAYAISVHKSQGGEYPAVVVPVIRQHYLMLQRNLLYTAITRAQRLCVLVGDRRAIAIAVRNDRAAQRHTALDWRLKEGD